MAEKEKSSECLTLVGADVPEAVVDWVADNGCKILEIYENVVEIEREYDSDIREIVDVLTPAESGDSVVKTVSENVFEMTASPQMYNTGIPDPSDPKQGPMSVLDYGNNTTKARLDSFTSGLTALDSHVRLARNQVDSQGAQELSKDYTLVIEASIRAQKRLDQMRLQVDYLAELRLEHGKLIPLPESSSLLRSEGIPGQMGTLYTDAGAQIARDYSLMVARDKEEKEAASLSNFTVGNPNKVLFREQCFLLSNIIDIASENTKTRDLPYNGKDNNASILVEGEPFGFMNLLTQSPKQSSLFDIKNAEISSLQPSIRLYKVIDNSLNPQEGEELQKEVELNFDSHAGVLNDNGATAVDRMMTSGGSRGFGVGIKNFSFSYEGSNPFAIKKSIKARLSIFANTFDELLEDRGEYRYIDLALKTGTSKALEQLVASGLTKDEVLRKQKIQELFKLNFRLKAVVGWASLNKNTILSPDVRDAIDKSFVTLNLTPVVHNFDIDDQGRVNFTIEYFAYVEDFFDQNSFDIFSDKTASFRREKRKLELKQIRKRCGSEKYSEEKNARAPYITLDKIEGVQSLVLDLYERDAIHYINIERGLLTDFLTSGPFFDYSSTSLEINNRSTNEATLDKTRTEITEAFMDTFSAHAKPDQKLDDAAYETMRDSLVTTSAKSENVTFFYLSDLVDTILFKIEDTLDTLPKEINSDSISPDSIALMSDQENPFILNEEERAEYKEEIEKASMRMRKFKENFEKFRVVLGPMEIVDAKNDSVSKHISIGDIPISVRYFVEWLTGQITKREIEVYTLTNFLSDVVNNLLRNFLSQEGCFDYSIKQKIRMNQAAVTGFRTTIEDPDALTQVANSQNLTSEDNFGLLGGHISVDNIKTERQERIELGHADSVLNISGERHIKNPGLSREINYLIYSAGRLRPTDSMKGERTQDEENGIFHYLIGKDSGIVKTIKLSRTEAKGLKEVRFEQEGYDGLEQLREVYDVNIKTYANVNTFPGTYIYVDPRGFAPNMKVDGGMLSDLTQYGIGGYCMIIRSEHSFGPGRADSEITAKWVAEIENEQVEGGAEIKASSGDGSLEPARCKTVLGRG